MKRVITLLLISLCSGIILHAQKWQKQFPAFTKASQSLKVDIVDKYNAWALAMPIADPPLYFLPGNYYTRTTDGGETWVTNALPSGYSGDLSNLTAISADKAWIGLQDYQSDTNGVAMVFRTKDGGQNWEKLNLQLNSYINMVHFFDENDGIVMGNPIGDEFQIFTTSDGGDTWQQVPSQDMPKAIDSGELGLNFDSYGTNANSLVFDTYYNRLFVTRDRGKHWGILEPSISGEGLTWFPHLDEDNNLYLPLYYPPKDTTDVWGATYMLQKYNLDDDTSWTDITPVDNKYYVSGFSSIPDGPTIVMNTVFKTLVSYDRGVHWLELSTTTTPYGFMSFYDSGIGYSVKLPDLADRLNNPCDEFYKYNGSPLTGLIHQKPLDAQISIGPNPVMNVLNINVKTDEAQHYAILIHDLSGKLFKTMETDKLSTIGVSVNVQDLPAGAYTLSISCQTGSKTIPFVKQ